MCLGHAFAQNLQRWWYEEGADERVGVDRDLDVARPAEADHEGALRLEFGRYPGLLVARVGIVEQDREGVAVDQADRAMTIFHRVETDQVDDERDQSGNLVLVIDDDPDQRALMTRFLHREGFRAREASDGETGLALARELKPKAILLDVMIWLVGAECVEA